MTAMTSTDNRTEEPDNFTAAVAAITAAVQTANDGHGPDGAEFIAHVLATVAANLGSTAAVTRARPGSWEAASVQQLLSSTVGYDDEYLMTYRTEPVEIVVDVDNELGDHGMWETYQASIDHIGQAMFGDRWDHSRGQLTDQELEQMEDVEELIWDLQDRDADAYKERFAATIQAELAALRAAAGTPNGPIRCQIPADLTVAVRFVTYPHNVTLTDTWDSGLLESHLYAAARDKTPLPGTDTAPPAMWLPVTELLAHTGWPHLRIPELTHYGTPNSKEE